jgi:hypothetical protein
LLHPILPALRLRDRGLAYVEWAGLILAMGRRRRMPVRAAASLGRSTTSAAGLPSRTERAFCWVPAPGPRSR